MKESRPSLPFLMVLGCIGLLVAIATPNFIHEPNTSPKNACINNLRQIDGAEQQWALENQKSNSDTPTWKDLQQYLGRPGAALPKCPSGGKYTLRAVSNTPVCSIPGHVLP